jgi:hypothetical protein
MLRRLPGAAVVSLALVLSAAAVSPAETNGAAGSHKLIVAVKKLPVLVLVSQNGGPPAAAIATPRKPLTVLLDNRGVYRVTVEIDSGCRGRCRAAYRISGAADHRLVVEPACRPRGSGVVCTRLRIVAVS